jgi:hypothetical protein
MRQPGDLGVLRGVERRVGGEDPWLCVTDFRQVCLYRNPIAFSTPISGKNNWELRVSSVSFIDAILTKRIPYLSM